MPRPRRLAADRILALSLAACLIPGGQTAKAQEDPFALPKDARTAAASQRSGPGLSEIVVDGRARARLVDLRWQGSELAIDVKTAEAAGLPVPAGASGFVPVAGLKIAGWSFDAVSQRLDVRLIRRSDGPNLIDLGGGSAAEGQSSPLTALIVDYDLTASHARGRPQFGGLIAASVVRGNTAFTADAQVGADANDARAVRLGTALQIAIPASKLVFTAGDFTTVGGDGQRALRLGGVQLATDFTLRPDLVTAPLPSFSGQVAVPTGLDLIINDRRFTAGQIEPGEFTVRNVPAAIGRGEMGVVVRDALGREQIQAARFYNSPDMLVPGLSQTVLNFGFLRRNYGQRSFDYGRPVATLFHRRGLRRGVTVEGGAEFTRGLANIGARVDVVIGTIAKATVEARKSWTGKNSEQTGNLLRLGVESLGQGVSFRLEAVLPDAKYRDAASTFGDALPARQFNGQVSVDLGQNSRFQITATRQQRRFDPRFPLLQRKADVVRATYRTRLSDRIDLTADAGYRHSGRGAVSALAGISIQFGGQRNAQLSASRGSGGTTVQGGFYKPDIVPGELGYAVEAARGEMERAAARIAWRTRHTRVEGQAEAIDGSIAMRANLRGSVIAGGGAIYARNQSGASYALVKTQNVAGVTVTRENRVAGVTDRSGRLLVEEIAANVPVKFDVEFENLPAEALARATERRVIVPRRAVGLVSLDVVRYRAATLRLAYADGEAVEAGTRVVAQPSGTAYLVGFDGMMEFNLAADDERLVLPGWPGGQCAARLPSPAKIAETTLAELRLSCAAQLLRVASRAQKPGGP